MNKIEQIFNQINSPAEFANHYSNYISELVKKIDPKSIETFINAIINTRENSGIIYFIGNGGSAATANHFVNDLGIGTRSEKKPFKAISLSANVSVLTAIGNDNGYDDIFYCQLKNRLNKNDLVVAISASGNSPNLIKAIDYANNCGTTTVGLTGFSGGKLKEISKIKIHVETEYGEYGPIEDIHMIINHMVGNYFAQYCKNNEL